MSGEHQDSGSLRADVEVDLQIKEIIQLIRKLVRARELYTKELIKKYQLSASQLHCILVLNEMGPIPPSKIAQHIMVNSSTVTGVIDRLEHKGFLERVRNSKDRRVITITLTGKGKELADNAPLPVQERMIEGIKGLPPQERTRIIKSLRTLTGMVEIQHSNMPEQSVSTLVM
ncbi:MAG: MarR family transcriptional regulator [Deltaproteobacteria bacterium]|nr:MarR family transcriptional regulator [Deltaproteobacteria bacterium]